ncbi:hypothetical protein DKX38_000329 [Salix brachista]|uniref:Uncharacterized protein n=1 Tax=Salix brachista TaxID=2182728 RepID=A0A5N5P0K6_9ROSI|nr:hypothetical protein DKX38_000329 [Salix brachista]
MVISSSICTKTTKNLLFKIVLPGGHIELHDKPVLAAEVMLCNPRCIVAYPHVFRQPWAIVAPDTVNMRSPSPCLHGDDERANTTGTNIKSKEISVETKTSCRSWYSDTKGLAEKRNKEMTTGSPSISASLDRWKPNLDSIVEEYEGN